MPAWVSARLTFANCVSLLALFVALGGSSYAALKVGSKQITNNGVRSVDIKNNDIRGKDVRDGTLGPKDVQGLLAGDFAAGQLPQGPPGPQGPAGAAGQNGSPDTAAQVLSKLATVDGDDSGLDADLVDGTTRTDLVARAVEAGDVNTNTPQPMTFVSYIMQTDAIRTFDFGQVLIKTNGTAGQFQVCDGSGGNGQFQFVAYVNGIRNAGLLPNDGCSSVFDAGVGGDFRVASRRAQIFGVPEGTANENYSLLGFTAL